MRVEEHDRPVGPGSVIFVPAQVEHRFHSITSDLSVLVVFAPPET
jgi:mannose-6-phosphate isomerase-like protein (cupin superfamily)